MPSVVFTVVGAAAVLLFAARDRLFPPATRIVVTENEDELGYRMGPDPLLGVMPADEWREMERNVLESV